MKKKTKKLVKPSRFGFVRMIEYKKKTGPRKRDGSILWVYSHFGGANADYEDANFLYCFGENSNNVFRNGKHEYSINDCCATYGYNPNITSSIKHAKKIGKDPFGGNLAEKAIEKYFNV